jgi:hypothetical protein
MSVEPGDGVTMRRLLVSVFAAALAMAPVGLAGTPAHADDSYAPEVPTSCHVDVPTVKVGRRVVLEIEVSSNSNLPEVGSVDLAISTAGPARAARASRVAARGVVWTRTVRYEGSPIKVVGPRLPRGQYRVTMEFTPDSGEFIGCRNAARFRVGAGGDNGGEDDDNPNLPNTGGPHLSLLLVGLALLAAGGGGVAESRRIRVTRRTA